MVLRSPQLEQLRRALGGEKEKRRTSTNKFAEKCGLVDFPPRATSEGLKPCFAKLHSKGKRYSPQQDCTFSPTSSGQTYLQARTLTEKAAAILQVNQTIGRFRDYAAINPKLQSSQVFINLQYELTGTENCIAVERMRYNRLVQVYDQKIQTFLNTLFTKTFGLEKKPFFQATKTEISRFAN